MEYYRVADAPQVIPYDPVFDGYGEIDEGDLMFDVECSRCRRPSNSDECENGLCPDCVEVTNV